MDKPPQLLLLHRKRARSAPPARAPLSPRARRATSLLAVAALLLSALVSGISLAAAPAAKAATCGTTNVALNKTATASSTENAGLPGVGRRGRQHRHPLVQRVLRPAVAAGRPRRHASSIPGRPCSGRPRTRRRSRSRPRADGTNWTTIYSTTTGTGGTQTLNVTGTGRYVRMYGTARGHPVRLLAVGVPGLRQPGQRQHLRHHGRRPQPARHRLLHREHRHARGDAVDGNTGTRWSSAVQRSPVAPGGPRVQQDDLRGHAELGDRLREGVPDPDVARRHQLDHDLLHHHRHRRRPGPHRLRHRPLRPHVRHGPRHPVRLLAVGIRRLHHGQRRWRHREHRHGDQPRQPEFHRGHRGQPAGPRHRLRVGPDADLQRQRASRRAVHQLLAPA